MPQEFEFHSAFSNVNHKQACKALGRWRSTNGNGIWQGDWGRLVLVVLVCVVLYSIILAYSPDSVIKSYTPYVMLAFLWVSFWKRIQRQQQKLQTAAIRLGETSYTLSENGLTGVHAGYEIFYRWSHVVGAIETNQGLLILISDYEYIPIELGAFQDETDMNHVAEQVRRWIATAKLGAE